LSFRRVQPRRKVLNMPLDNQSNFAITLLRLNSYIKKLTWTIKMTLASITGIRNCPLLQTDILLTSLNDACLVKLKNLLQRDYRRNR